MPRALNLSRQLAQLLRSRRTSSYFLNGVPGSGKTTLLNQLAEQLRSDISHSFILGPYQMQADEVTQIAGRIIHECKQFGFLDQSADVTSIEAGLVALWQWLDNHLIVQPDQVFVVLLDTQEARLTVSLDQLAQLFSSIRALEGPSGPRHFRLLHIVAGYWRHDILEQEFRQMHTSFPYTVGNNFVRVDGMQPDDVIQLLPDQPHHKLRGLLLHELTDGYAAAVTEMIARIGTAPATLSRQMTILDEMAASGGVGERLLSTWQECPAPAVKIIEALITSGYRRIWPADWTSDLLVLMGIARIEVIDRVSFIRFRSWYAELLVRYHLDALKINDEKIKAIRPLDLAPEIMTYNIEALQVIRRVETRLRNFAVIQLTRHKFPDIFDLEGWVTRTNDSGINEDLQERVRSIQARSAVNGLQTRLNSLITYSTTSELVALILEMSGRWKVPEWKLLADTVRDLPALRNVVMHNQLVDDTGLEILYKMEISLLDQLARIH